METIIIALLIGIFLLLLVLVLLLLKNQRNSKTESVPLTPGDEAAAEVARDLAESQASPEPERVGRPDDEDSLAQLQSPEKFIIGNHSDPALTIERLEERPAGLQKLSNIGSEGMSRLSSAIQPAAVALGAAYTSSQTGGEKRFYLLKMSEASMHDSLTRAADGDGLRTFVQGDGGKIVENARGYALNGVQIGAAALVAWQIVSIAAAQKHLSDINKRLASIDKNIKAILNKLKENDRAQLLACRDVVVRIAKHVEEVPPGSEQARQDFRDLNDNIRLCDELYYKSVAEVRSLLNNFYNKDKNNDDFVGSEIACKAAMDLMLSVRAELEFRNMVIRIKLATLHLLYAVSDHKSSVLRRISEINELEFSRSEELLDLHDAMEREVEAIGKTFFNRRSTLQSRQRRLKRALKDLRKYGSSAQRSNRQTVALMLKKLEDRVEPGGENSLLVEADENGAPLAVYQSDEMAA